MSFSTLSDLAGQPDLDLDSYLAAAEQKHDDVGQRDVVEILVFRDRLDLVEKLISHPTYGEDAKIEWDIHQMMERHRKEWAERVAAYPPIMQEFEKLLRGAPRIGIYSWCYPSAQALQFDLGENYAAVSGDGLFLFLFKVLSVKDRGQFQLVLHPNPKYPGNSYAEEFCQVNSVSVGHIFTGDELLKALGKMYGC
jgi:hypothetical protein